MISLPYFLSYDFLFLEIGINIQNLFPHTHFKYMIKNIFHGILDTSRKTLTILIYKLQTAAASEEENPSKF